MKKKVKNPYLTFPLTGQGTKFPPHLSRGGPRRGFVFLVFFYFLLFYKSFPALAQHFESSSYIIDWGNFNMTSGSKNSANYKLTDTVGQNAPGQYNGNSYIVKSGFQYIYENNVAFTFKIDNRNIAFGSLVPMVGSTASNIITITTPSGRGYEIYVAQNHPLQLINGSTQIPDTTCDSGACTESASAVWSSSSIYGFGFSAMGINTSGVATGVGTTSYFLNNTYYRQFANRAAAETPQIIMSESSPTKSSSAKITYKVNISAIQAEGKYENSINFIAIPKY